MKLTKTKEDGIYVDVNCNYVIDGTRGEWRTYFTPGGPAETLGTPFKKFRSAEYVCNYHEVTRNFPNGE